MPSSPRFQSKDRSRQACSHGDLSRCWSRWAWEIAPRFRRLVDFFRVSDKSGWEKAEPQPLQTTALLPLLSRLGGSSGLERGRGCLFSQAVSWVTSRVFSMEPWHASSQQLPPGSRRALRLPQAAPAVPECHGAARAHFLLFT